MNPQAKATFAAALSRFRRTPPGHPKPLPKPKDTTMAKIARTITYVDTQTGHTHKIDAQVEAGATRKQVAAALARLCGAPVSRFRVTAVK